MLKINTLMIVTVFLVSSVILPVGVSYATYGGSMQPPSSSTNQTMTMSSNSTNTNSTMTMTTNSTSTNSTITMHDNATMTMHANSTSTNSTMTTPTNSTNTNSTMTMTTNSTMNMPQNNGQTNMTTTHPSAPMSPLQQFKSGVSAKSVTCQSGYSLVIKAEDGSPACVHSSTVQVLIARGWATQ